jgi:predicted secreted hydrolase
MGLLSEKWWSKMIAHLRILAIVFLLLLGGAGSLLGSDWKQAVGPWEWSFPRDHGSHPNFRTEWWYFTGNLSDPLARRFGYQLTFFRQGVVFKPKDPTNPWSVRDLFPAHFALTDGSGGRFSYAERLCRGGPGLAGASQNQMDVWLLNWSARMKENTIRIEARDRTMELSLELTPRKPMVFHGQNGLSKKGPEEGQASYYFSYTDLATTGWIKTPTLPSPLFVKGRSWLDHEFGSNQLASNQVGWDWFSLHLSNGQDLMLYFLRRSDGSIEPTSSGTLVNSDGRTTNLNLSEMSVEVLVYWKSPKTEGKYPNRWKIDIPVAGIELVLNPLLANQELVTEGSTGVVYWEGAVDGKGRSRGQEVTCEGYVEMTGYAGSLAGSF